ncbi:cysteine proteinase [Bimuria novae-zelandiae CBS 107.79]|uniref:Cysteine proteinase n=1 Tax=Bimuria novae-zelandiae CBS 107.79 TaxID=1447943 RepID=A0A6A5V305_9PLEO|nr:cysteine proteinase [Bimuria novae-zelandiae CBS 107.79]
MSGSPGKNFEKWRGDSTLYFHCRPFLCVIKPSQALTISVTRNDIYTLATPDAWLEDNVIHFWIEYLEHEELSKFPKANIRFVDPNVGSLLKNASTDVLYDIFNSSDYHQDKVTHIFIPVNDDRVADHEYAGGTATGNHWSLLVVSLLDNVAFHYDSLRGLNQTDAQNMVAKIQEALPARRTLRFVPMGADDAPQQRDGSNCGTFVCIVMKHLLLKRLLRADANQKVTMSMKGQDIDYEGARKMILAVIEERRNYAIENG